VAKKHVKPPNCLPLNVLLGIETPKTLGPVCVIRLQCFVQSVWLRINLIYFKRWWEKRKNGKTCYLV